jgi:tRNA dimethylallyltransferase
MWVQWLSRGRPDAPKADQSAKTKVNELISDFEENSLWDEALAVCRTYDSERFDKIGQNDWYRLRRYLEIAVSLQNEQKDSIGKDKVKKTLTGERENMLIGLDLRCFFLSEEREQLYRCIDSRCQDMLSAGLIQEVAKLIVNNVLTPTTMGAKSIGYRQTIEYLCKSDWENNDSVAFEDYVKYVMYN